MAQNVIPEDRVSINYSLGEAQYVVNTLNGTDASAKTMRRHWLQWQQGDDARHDLLEELNKLVLEWRLVCLPAGRKEVKGNPKLPKGMLLMGLMPEHTGGKPFMWWALPAKANWTEATAALFFCRFISSEYAELVGQCPRCQRYFLRRRGDRRKIFCSATCAKRESATKAVTAIREKEHQEKLARVRLWYQRIGKKPAGEDWKRWIAKKTKVSVSWITRAIRRGELAESPFGENK